MDIKNKLKQQFTKRVLCGDMFFSVEVDIDKLLDALIEARDIAKEFAKYGSAGFSDEYIQKITKIIESWDA
jgi:hypothetical protein